MLMEVFKSYIKALNLIFTKKYFSTFVSLDIHLYKLQMIQIIVNKINSIIELLFKCAEHFQKLLIHTLK